MTKFGATVPVMQVGPNDHRLRSLYESEILLAEWAGDSTKAEKLKSQRDGFDFEKLDVYAKNSTDEATEPIGHAPLSKATPAASNDSYDSYGGKWTARVWLAVSSAALGWFFMFLTLRRFTLNSRSAAFLEAWSLPQLVAVGAFVVALVAFPIMGLLSGAAVAVAFSIRRAACAPADEP